MMIQAVGIAGRSPALGHVGTSVLPQRVNITMTVIGQAVWTSIRVGKARCREGDSRKRLWIVVRTLSGVLPTSSSEANLFQKICLILLSMAYLYLSTVVRLLVILIVTVRLIMMMIIIGQNHGYLGVWHCENFSWHPFKSAVCYTTRYSCVSSELFASRLLKVGAVPYSKPSVSMWRSVELLGRQRARIVIRIAYVNDHDHGNVVDHNHGHNLVMIMMIT